MPIIRTDKELRERDPNDFYPTPYELCREALIKFRDLYGWDSSYKTILDPGAGNGVWGKAFSENLGIENHLYGVDIRDIDREDLIYKNYSWYYGNTDYLTDCEDLGSYFDLIMGNPPYKYAEEFVRKSWDLLDDDGYIVFLLRLAFLEGQRRHSNFYTKGFKPDRVLVLPRRPSFTGNRKTDATAYAIYIWKKSNDVLETKLDWLEWDYDEDN